MGFHIKRRGWLTFFYCGKRPVSEEEPGGGRIVIRVSGEGGCRARELNPDVGTEARDEERLESGGPRIRCPLCGWQPGRHDQWTCDCGHSWNTFDTGGVCPGCLRQWTETQCPSCGGWSLHSDWYVY